MRNKATRRRRSIPQAFIRDTHTWHHGVLAESPLARWTVAIPQAPPFETPVVSRHINTSHSPCRRWISQAQTSQVASQSQHIKSSHSPCRRSIPQALIRDTHTWHHCVLPEYPLACLIDAIPQAPVRDTPVASRHIKTSHSQCRRWSSQAQTSQVASQSQHIKSSHSPCRRSIPQALVRDTHTWHHCVLPESPLARWTDAIQPSPRTKVGLPNPLLNAKSNAFFFFYSPLTAGKTKAR